MHRQAQINLSLQDPFVFGDWEETGICSETCGEGKVLEKRSCTPTHPDKSCASLQANDTLRLGDKTCVGEPCKGDSKINLLDID